MKVKNPLPWLRNNHCIRDGVLHIQSISQSDAWTKVDADEKTISKLEALPS